MLELARINTDQQVGVNWANSEPRGLVVGLARTPDEIEALQRFRYEVFTQDMHAVFPDARDGLRRLLSDAGTGGY